MALLTEVVVLYRKVVRLWWTFDDLDIIHVNSDFTIGELFTRRDAWGQQLFTPLMNAAFKAAEHAFGLGTDQWYEAHLGIAFLAACSVYFAARSMLPPLQSWAAAALLIAAPAMSSVVSQLSTVHYLIVIIAGAISLALFVIAARRGSDALAVFSPAFYLFAMLAKEVAIPLPVVLLFLPIGTLGRRMRLLTGHAIALVVYVVWRRSVLGSFFGAYGWVITPQEWPRLIRLLPWRVVSAAGLPAAIFAMILIGIGIGVNIRNARALLLIAVVFVASLMPLLPVAKEVNRRYALVPSLAIALVFAASAGSLRRRRIATATLLLAPCVAVIVNRQDWSAEFAKRLAISNEARAFFDMPPNGLLRLLNAPPSVIRSVQWVKTGYLHAAGGAGWFCDEFYLCSHDVAEKRVWQFDAASRRIVEITRQVPRIASDFCAAARNEKALAVQFAYRKPALYWDLGPYAAGRYTALVNEGVEAFVVPRHDGLYVPGALGINLRVRYDSPQGWTTYSPEFKLDFVHHPDVTWKR